MKYSAILFFASYMMLFVYDTVIIQDLQVPIWLSVQTMSDYQVQVWLSGLARFRFYVTTVYCFSYISFIALLIASVARKGLRQYCKNLFAACKQIIAVFSKDISTKILLCSSTFFLTCFFLPAFIPFMPNGFSWLPAIILSVLMFSLTCLSKYPNQGIS